MPTPDLKSHIPQGARIILVRHGRPALPLRPRTSHRGFHDYIDAYEAAGLDPESLPPRELADLVKEAPRRWRPMPNSLPIRCLRKRRWLRPEFRCSRCACPNGR
jgi:hypothetical protein